MRRELSLNLFRRILPLVALLTVVPAGGAEAQNLQGWFNAIINWEKSDRLVYELDFEPKGLLVASEGEPDWRNVDITPNVEFSPNGWLDLIGESVIGYTRQTDDLNSFEVSPRVGVRFHYLSRGVPTAVRSKERPPARRIVLRDLVRVEFRNMFYTGEGSGSDFTVRFRNRLEFLVPLNKEKISDDGAAISWPTGNGTSRSTTSRSASRTSSASGPVSGTDAAAPGGSRRCIYGFGRAIRSKTVSGRRRTSSTSV